MAINSCTSKVFFSFIKVLARHCIRMRTCIYVCVCVAPPAVINGLAIAAREVLSRERPVDYQLIRDTRQINDGKVKL